MKPQYKCGAIYLQLSHPHLDSLNKNCFLYSLTCCVFFSGIVKYSLVAFKGISCCLAFFMLVGRNSVLALSWKKSHFFFFLSPMPINFGVIIV